MTTTLAPAPAVELRPLPRAGGRAAVVVNPTKFSRPGQLHSFCEDVEAELASLGWTVPLWLITTATTRGAAETDAAVAAEVDVVLVAGGDGTVRTVAQQLAGTGVPMGLLPAGTGNLLARNLGMPLSDLRAAVRAACQSPARPLDVGWLELDRDGDGRYTDRYAFLVMGGAGIDAAIMSGANHAMKSRLGHLAYLVSALRVLGDKTSSATLSFDDGAAVDVEFRGFVVGNCGSLTMGLSLLPAADPTDGILDTVVLLPRTPLQWARAAWSVLTRAGTSHRLLPRHRSRRLEFRSVEPQQIEVDGDVVGTAHRVRARVQRCGILVRWGRP